MRWDLNLWCSSHRLFVINVIRLTHCQVFFYLKPSGWDLVTSIVISINNIFPLRHTSTHTVYYIRSMHGKDTKETFHVTRNKLCYFRNWKIYQHWSGSTGDVDTWNVLPSKWSFCVFLPLAPCCHFTADAGAAVVDRLVVHKGIRMSFIFLKCLSKSLTKTLEPVYAQGRFTLNVD